MSRRALLVANDSYRDPALNGLISPETDAVELAEVLRDSRIGGFEIDDDDVLVNESKPTVEQAIERLFSEARPDDLVLLYFSGHGVRSRRRRLHFAVPKTNVGSGLASTSISASFVKECMADSDAESIVVLLDCCYSGLFAEDGIKAAPQPDIGRELEELASGRGVFILTATDAVQEALDGAVDSSGSPGQSVFTSTVVHGLRTGKADGGDDGVITTTDLWEYVSREVPKRTGRQTPTQVGRLEEPIPLARVQSKAPRLHLDSGSRLCLGSLTGELEMTVEHGLRATSWEGSGHLIVPLGQVVARGERGETMPVSLDRMGGHLLAVGRMGSGKSTLLRTLACSLALTHSPHELQLEFLESGANKLGSLQGLPHVRGVVGDDEPESAMAVLERTHEIVKQRKRLFREYGLVSAEHFRSHRVSLPGGPHPDLVVFIDQWSDFAGAIPKFAARIESLANVGREFGVHLAVATRRPDDLAQRLRELFSSYVELHLADPEHSLIDPDLARRLPESEPGWALSGRTRFRVSQPFLKEDSADDQPFTDGASEIVDLVSRCWAEVEPPEFVPWPDAEPSGASVSEPVPERVGPLDQSVGLGAILGFGVDTFTPRSHWREKPIEDYLKAPIGLGADGSIVGIDFK
ncbi:caspase, EACC1-associated type, partial [Glycomyces tenuis]|uniref:caspase, EACC1-associated type n=1 Tax=Glycomyces tenuis TaxID=58116 RepID=UPI001B801470